MTITTRRRLGLTAIAASLLMVDSGERKAARASFFTRRRKPGHTGHGTMAEVPAECEPQMAEPDPVFEGASAAMAFTVRLQLLKGHLQVGDELFRAKAWQDTLPHFYHPLEEIYSDLRAELFELNLEPFGDALDILARAVRKRVALVVYEVQLARVLERVDASMAAIQPKVRDAPTFIAQVIRRTLSVAAIEYRNAFADGKLVNPMEYQDSRGFVRVTSSYLLANRAILSSASEAMTSGVEAIIAELVAVWPTVAAPSVPVRDAAAVEGMVEAIGQRLDVLET